MQTVCLPITKTLIVNIQKHQKSSDILRLKISLCTQPLLSPGRNVSFALTLFGRSQKHVVTCKHFQGDPAEKCQLEEVCECGGCRDGQDSKCPHLNKHAPCVCVCVCVWCWWWWARACRPLQLGENNRLLQEKC